MTRTTGTVTAPGTPEVIRQRRELNRADERRERDAHEGGAAERLAVECERSIYGLVDPDSDRIMYVGATTRSLSRRLYGHMSESRRKPDLPKSKWIKSLGERRPGIVLLEVAGVNWRESEQRWIERLPGLLNAARGGAGCPPTPKSPEHVAKVQAALQGRQGQPCSAEQRAKISAALKGKKKSPETVERMRLARQGSGAALARLDEEQVLKIREEFAAGATRQELALRTGMSRAAIADIVARRRWKHI